jgi:hypothetical protein
MGGTGMTDVIRLHDKQVKILQTHSYFLNKQTTTPLHAAVVKADDGYTPLDLLHTMKTNWPQMKNTITPARPTSVKNMQAWKRRTNG